MKTDLTNYNINENSFKFVNEDIKIGDQKLDTKPTTFAKDSFKRFCKSKSSVVAAIILGVLILLAIFVPWITGIDVNKVSSPERFLQPKLFSAGTGFWDGTKKYEKKVNLDGSTSGVIFDTSLQIPAGFNILAVSKLVVDSEPTLIDQASQYGKGGYVMFENQNFETLSTTTLTSWKFNLNAVDNYKMALTFNSEENVGNGVLGEYRILLTNGEEEILLKDWSQDYGEYTIDLSKALSDNAFAVFENAQVVFELKAIEGKYSYVLIEKCVFTTDNQDAYILAEDGSHVDFAELGFTDATQMVLKTKNELNVFPAGYWSCSGRKGIHASQVYFCEFVYDTYEAAYGLSQVVYSADDFNDFISQGLCSYDPSVGPESFVKLSDDCPIESVIEQKINTKTGRLLQVTGESYKYKQLGYKKMPRFLFGTDAVGVDVLTRMFAGLRTSLMLGVFTFAFCFTFGLIWGSVSGYFGGIVDLSMERFCDILGGVPWIVIMTLSILHLGNNFFTFFLALCLTGWMGTAARTRTQFYRFKNMEYVLASRTLGSGNLRLIFKHILPNSLGTIVTSSVLMIPSVIFSESTLAYLNLGLQGVASFGVMLSDNQQFIQSQSFLIVIPSIVMALLMISFNLFGNGLRDAINPTLKGA